MRFKVEGVPPLPYFKAWFNVHSATTILELKSVLCSELPALQNGRVQGEDLILVLEDFELLDATPIDVIRDGDLIIVKRSTPVSSNKRKASVEDLSPARKRAKRYNDAIVTAPRAASRKPQPSGHASQKAPVKPSACLSSDSDSDSSSDSEAESDSSSSSSEDDSDSDSDSDSSSETSSSGSSEDSSASSVPSAKHTRVVRANTRAVKAVQSTAQVATISDGAQSLSAPPQIPPGLGKPATHSRNLRRRRKRMYERLASTAEPASVNAIPLGARIQDVEPLVPAPAESPAPPAEDGLQDAVPHVVMMASLQNKNKKKGFKKSMSSAFPSKIVFADPEDAVESASSTRQDLQEALPFTRAENNEVFLANTRLIPPSEKQGKGLLPPNMFVTSIDVEDGLRSKKRKKKHQNLDYSDYAEEVDLPYDEPEQHAGASGLNSDVLVVPTKAAIAVPVDREEVISRWATLVKITAQSQVVSGSYVGWKELGINPRTFSPEMLLHIGRVLRCGEQLVVEPFLEEAMTEVSFGGLIRVDESDSVEQCYEWRDVFQGDWRILP